MFSVNVPEHRVTFGAKDSNPAYKSLFGKGMALFKVKDDSNFWEVDLKDVKYGDTQLSFGGNRTVFFDTGISYNMIPKSDLEIIMKSMD